MNSKIEEASIDAGFRKISKKTVPRIKAILRNHYLESSCLNADLAQTAVKETEQGIINSGAP